MRGRLERIGPFRLAAAVLVFFGVVALLAVVQSPSLIMVNGIAVTGHTHAGVTRYEYDGSFYTLTNRTDHRPDRHRTTVWLSRADPADAGKAYIDQPVVRWIDRLAPMGLFTGALLLLVVGLVRDRRRERDLARRVGQPGAGLPEDFVRRQLSIR